MTRRWCVEIGCPEYARSGSSRCEVHAAARDRERGRERPNAARRGYDGSWQQVARGVLQERPTCERCGGVATVVHHRRPIREGGARLDPANLEALCRACHGRAHAAR